MSFMSDIRILPVARSYGLVFFVLCILVYLFVYKYVSNIQLDKKAVIPPMKSKQDRMVHLSNSVDFRKTYLVLWHKIPAYLGRKSEAVSANFSVCEYHNCVLTTNSTLANISDAILWHRTQNGAITFKRPVGQIWVYVDHESPALLDLNLFKGWKPNLQYWMGKFNWTMTYNKAVADIHMPYGELRKHKTYIDKDYDRIAASKTRGALIISSHCSTNSKRQEYVNQLKKYVDVEVLGTCGKRWSCGKRLVHDNCFDILNTSYSFYLAFENALCEQYHTEKLFENFKYDILFVSRGGLPRELNTFLPGGSVIDSRAFKSERELGTYLKHLQRNKHEYAKLLSAKSQFYSIDYRHSYQRALCDLCHRLNHQETYRKTIPNLRDVFSHKKSCKAG